RHSRRRRDTGLGPPPRHDARRGVVPRPERRPAARRLARVRQSLLESALPAAHRRPARRAAADAVLGVRDGPSAQRAAPRRSDLAVGSWAKAFLLPWGLVCLGVLAVVSRHQRWRPLTRAVPVWLALVGAWAAVLSVRAHRVTYGEAGRLTYAWYVANEDNDPPPSAGLVPPGAQNATLTRIMPGVGVTGD